MTTARIQKHLANQGVGSRRAIEALIKNNKIVRPEKPSMLRPETPM